MNSRYFKVLVLISFGFVKCFGQEYVYPVSTTSQDLTVRIKLGFTKLVVTGSNEKVIKIKLLNGTRNNDDRAEGLTPITPWPDNTGLGIHISDSENIINLIKITQRSKASYEITVPNWANLYVVETEWGRGDFHISGIKGSVSIESNSSNITLIDIQGSVETETTSGNIQIEMPLAGKGVKHEINSVSGITHLLIEKDSQYSFDLSTVSGTLKADFELIKEIDYKGSKLIRISRPKEIITDLNGGGDKIEANTVSGLINISYIK